MFLREVRELENRKKGKKEEGARSPPALQHPNHLGRDGDRDPDPDRQEQSLVNRIREDRRRRDRAVLALFLTRFLLGADDLGRRSSLCDRVRRGGGRVRFRPGDVFRVVVVRALLQPFDGALDPVPSSSSSFRLVLVVTPPLPVQLVEDPVFGTSDAVGPDRVEDEETQAKVDGREAEVHDDGRPAVLSEQVLDFLRQRNLLRVFRLGGTLFLLLVLLLLLL